MNTKDPTVEKTELVIKALNYAHDNNLDIHSKEDVVKILQALDPEHTSDNEVEEFTMLLHASYSLMKKDADRRNKLN
ncbi:MAG TPA: hypothetical protein VMR41_02660 [Patescibacteria group bacterium]|nr:hypothetical protein [Patescibacteria group bacterium]